MSEIRQKPKAQVFGRMLGHGVNYIDYDKMVKRTANGEDYVAVCEDLGDKDLEMAHEAYLTGHRDTASIFYFAACHMYRVGAYGLIDLTEENQRLIDKKHFAFERGVATCDMYDYEKVLLPYQNTYMVGWLFIPKGVDKKVSVVFGAPGYTGFKEERYAELCEYLMKRKIALLCIDVPGHGESLYSYHCYQEVDIHGANSVILKYLKHHPRLNGKVGVYGSSYAGYYSLRTAGTETDDISCCCAKGGSYHPAEFAVKDPAYKYKMCLRFGVPYEKKEELFENEAQQMDLNGFADKITCPLLIVHSDEDPLFDVEGVKRAYEEAPSKDKTLHIFHSKVHCADDDDTIATTLVADWLADHLL